MTGLRVDADWRQAFCSDDVPPFLEADIAEVLGAAVRYGDCAETDIVLLVRLVDGRFGQATAWCDTTGWGCQDGFTGSIHATLEEAWTSLGDEARDMLIGAAP